MKFLFSVKVFVFSAAVAISGWTFSLNPVNTNIDQTENAKEVELGRVEGVEGIERPSATISSCGRGASFEPIEDIWWH